MNLKLERIDGLNVSISGDEEAMAMLDKLSNSIGQTPVQATNTVEVLDIPTMSFGAGADAPPQVPAPQQPTPFPYFRPLDSQVLNVPTGAKVEPLPVPTMDFSKQAAPVANQKAVAKIGGIEPLDLPKMEFGLRPSAQRSRS